MQRQFGHQSKSVLMQLLRSVRADPQYVRAARLLKCEAYEDRGRPQTTQATLPLNFVFNRTVGLDTLEGKVATGTRSSGINIVDMGATHQQVIFLYNGGSLASRQTCLGAFVGLWVSWAVWPKV